MNSLLKTAGVFLVAAACLLGSTACGAKSRSKSGKSKTKTVENEKRSSPKTSSPKEGFRVVRIDGTPRVVTEAELEGIRFELRSTYKEQLARYKKEKQEAQKSNATFDKPKPTRPRLKVAKKSFATRAEAEAYRDQLLTKDKSAKAKPTPAGKSSESGGS